MNTFIKNNGQTILLLILIGFVVYNFFYTQDIKTNINMYKSRVKSLNVEIDTLKSINSNIDIKLNGVNDNIIQINDEIGKVDTDIKKFKQKTNEKINSVDDYTFNELEQFFTDRYN